MLNRRYPGALARLPWAAAVLLLHAVSGGAAGDAAEPRPAFAIGFAADGRPSSFADAAGAENWVAAAGPGPGFFVRCSDSAPMRLDRIEQRDGRIVASCRGGLPRVTLVMRGDDAYAAFRIERIEGIPPSREYALHFQVHLDREVRVTPLDWMTQARCDAAPGGAGRRLAVDWRHVWNRHASNPLGGFALYRTGSEAEEDDTLLRIWVQEGLPHPAVEGAWTLEAARAWVARWLDEHRDQSRFWIAAQTPEDLYAAVPYAERSGARHVYLFTDTWRGGRREPFFTNRAANAAINTAVFPRGEEDLKSFSHYLRERNLQLKLHWVSGGIGYRDPVYASPPDERLAAWGRGTLAAPLGPRDKTLHLRPEPGVAAPFKLPQTEWEARYAGLPALHPWFDFDMLAVGGELMRIASFEDTDQDVWRIEIAARGFGRTAAAPHEAGAEARGLISAYGCQFVPDNDSTLLDEVAGAYAGLLNRCGISHVEYDGAEIHSYNGRMWGFEKFAAAVYRQLDHPATSYTSGGAAPASHFEYRLHAVQKTGRDRQKGIVPILLDAPFRPASNLLDAHWGMSQTCAHGYTVYQIMKPEPLFGLDIAALRGHGLTDELLATARNWKRVNGLVTEAQRAQIRSTLYHAPDIAEQAGSHEKSQIVHVLSQQPGRWEIHPTRVLTRAGNLDTVWHDGQEHGAIGPRQFLKPGETLALDNPFAAQPPRILMRVLWAFERSAPAGQAEAGSERSKRSATDNFDYQAMSDAAKTSAAPGGNILLQPRADEFRNLGDTHIRGEGAAVAIRFENPGAAPVVNEHGLPEWSRNVNMIAHRGIGAWVTGDGSGAVLAIQIPGGDYVLPIDFTGRRYIEIPNAQAAWSTGYWGWRMGSKHTQYDRVGWLRMGFGVVPAATAAEVRVEGLTALREHAAELRNPRFTIGDSALHLEGAVASGQYLAWEGGAHATVYDANWHRAGELPVRENTLAAPHGGVQFSVSGGDRPAQPWLEVQVMTRGTPIAVPDPGLAGG